MQDKLDELHCIYKMIGNYGFRTVQELLDKYKTQKEVIDKIFSRITLLKMEDITIETSKVLNEILDISKGKEE